MLDLRSIDTYLLAQPLTWLAVEQEGAVWCPLESPPTRLDRDRKAARRAADRLQLPLTWPERHPTPVPRAMRVAALVCARRAGASCMFGMSRLAFGAGADFDEPEQYLLAVEETAVTAREATMAAEDGSAWDARLTSLARELHALGVPSAPALRWHGRLYLGAGAIAPVLARSPSSQPAPDLF